MVWLTSINSDLCALPLNLYFSQSFSVCKLALNFCYIYIFSTSNKLVYKFKFNFTFWNELSHLLLAFKLITEIQTLHFNFFKDIFKTSASQKTLMSKKNVH